MRTHQRNSTNHTGWSVMLLTSHGWIAIGQPITARPDADARMQFLALAVPEFELRVYEAVESRQEQAAREASELVERAQHTARVVDRAMA